MRPTPRNILLITLLAAASGPSSAFAQLAVSSTSPALNASNIATDAAITVSFDRPVDPATFTPANFGAFARWSGPVAGPLSFSDANRTVTLTPARHFAAGEPVMLIMSHNLRAADGTFLRQAGYTLTFTTRVLPTPGFFRHLATLSDRDSTGAQTRVYGGLACDLNLDGWPDLTIVNEVSADLRVFMNRADGSGLFGPMLQPYTPVPHDSSPNEPGDFNRDGFVDVVTSSDGTDQIALAMGNGDGTFDPPVLINVGDNPRGFGILDADGDGDLDITVANANSGNIALLINNGAGVFAAPTFITSSGGPYGMTAADMNADGILDLVVGHRDSQMVKVFRGNGDATFTQVSSRSVGGNNWVIACADLNGDFKMDVAAANAGSATASTLLGNGDGTLQAATIFPIGGHTVAVDLVDIDGDGDTDLTVSSFGAGIWKLYRNDGAGHFTFDRDFEAPANPSCCLPADFDNDGDADLALIDEIADVIVIMANVCPADYNGDRLVDFADYLEFLNLYNAEDPDADLNLDGFVDFADYLEFLNHYDAGC